MEVSVKCRYDLSVSPPESFRSRGNANTRPPLCDASEFEQVLERAAEAIELGDHELVSGASGEQGLVELRAAGELAARVVDEHLLAAGGRKRVALGIKVLFSGRDPSVSDPHQPSVRKRPAALRRRVHGMRYQTPPEISGFAVCRCGCPQTIVRGRSRGVVVATLAGRAIRLSMPCDRREVEAQSRGCAQGFA